MALVSHSLVVVWIHVQWEERLRHPQVYQVIHPQVYKVIHPQVYQVIRHFQKEKGTGADIAIFVWPWKMVSVCSLFVLERFSLDCRKTKTKVNTLANQRA